MVGTSKKNELNHLATSDDLKAFELRIVRWMIALLALTAGAITAIDKLT